MLTSVNVSPSDAKVEYSIDNGKTYIENIPHIVNASSVFVIVKASRIGYKTETVTKTAVVNKAEGKLTLSETSGTITYPNNTVFTVSENTGTLSVSSNNNNIATASGSGNPRFNVMALSDYNKGNIYDLETAKSITSGDWSTATIDTWTTFAGQLNITTSNYSEYGLQESYWSSSYLSFNHSMGYYISFYNGKIFSESHGTGFPIRLARTF